MDNAGDVLRSFMLLESDDCLSEIFAGALVILASFRCILSYSKFS